MPSKYMIHTRPVPHRFKPISKSGVIAWEEGCLKCAVCVKKQCVYEVYDHRGLDPGQMIDSIDYQCMNCLRCIQNCPKQLIHKSINPEYRSMGDSYWTPDIIAKLWYQAETGKIPVSGAGYPGPFSGSGFDSMWTDMSEIVRPTRDGIHGREYISTSTDLGGAPKYLLFTNKGDPKGEPFSKDGPLSLLDIPMPIMIKVPSFGSLSEKTIKGWATAAERLGIFLALPEDMIRDDMESRASHCIPILKSPISQQRGSKKIRLVEIPHSDGWKNTMKAAERSYPSARISVRIPFAKGVVEGIASLIDEGVSIIHLEGSPFGRTLDDEQGFIKDGIRSAHLALVEAGVRDEVTLIASGGIAMAEHVAKAVICGADAVYIDFPALIALECRMCRRCEKNLSCPVEIKKAPYKWVAARIVNLIGAWHNQLLEVMGAMGIRDIRRLRGETGRAMFFEELDEEIFESFNRVEDGCELE